MINLQGLNKQYLRPGQEPLVALRDVSLTVPEGQIRGVIGRSGAGKSTLIRCVNLLERPDSGTVCVDSKHLETLDMPALRQARRTIAMVFQHFNLLSTRTVAQNVAFPLHLAGLDDTAISARVNELLDRMGLEGKASAFPSELSGGQKQRVAIARALATQPRVLLCDEMTSALDPESTQSILRCLREIQKDLSLTILLITHEMDVIKSVADHVTVMGDGCVVEEGSVVSIFSKPQHAITQQLVDSTEHMLLPSAIQSAITWFHSPGSLTLLELSFAGALAAQPIIGESVRRFGVEVSILQANLSTLKDLLVGKMLIACDCSDSVLDQLQIFYENAGLNVEKKGYVKQSDWSVC